jgi:hypothetical protein
MQRNSRGFANHLLLGLLVTIGLGGTAGLGTVWMRHQISTTANTNRAIAAEIDRLTRLIDEKTTVIESELSPDKLRALNTSMRLGLVPMNEVPVELVTANTLERLVRRANTDAPLERIHLPAISTQVAQH